MKKKNILRRLMPLVLTLALMVPLFQPMTTMETSAKKVTQAEIDKLKDDAAQLNKDKKDIQQQLKDVRADKNAAINKKSLIEKEIAVIQAEIDNATAQINKLSAAIGEKETEIAEAQAQEEEQYRMFCKRVRFMEERGQVSYWSILFSSDSFSDLLDNFMMVEEIIDYDNALMDSLIAAREAIEAEKANLEGLKADAEAARKKSQEAKAEEAARQAEVDKIIDEIKDKEDFLEEREAELRKAANAVDAELRRKEKEMADQIANVPSESGFLWPLPGYDTLSSLYGPRKDPITGRPGNHTGIDIPAPRGTKILSSKSGVVVTSVRHPRYGEYVVVSHSDGTSTLYAHMSKRLVKVGQTVKQGEVLGLVGTTGYSTGNHLHYEIRVNGSRIDPVNCYKSKTLYYRDGGPKVKLPH